MNVIIKHYINVLHFQRIKSLLTSHEKCNNHLLDSLLSWTLLHKAKLVSQQNFLHTASPKRMDRARW